MSSILSAHAPFIPCESSQQCVDYLTNIYLQSIPQANRDVLTNNTLQDSALFRMRCYGKDIGCNCRGDFYWQGSYCNETSTVSQSNSYLAIASLCLVFILFLVRFLPIVHWNILRRKRQNDHAALEKQKSVKKGKHQRYAIICGSWITIDTRDLVVFLAVAVSYILTPLFLLSNILVHILGPGNMDSLTSIYLERIESVVHASQLVVGFATLILLAICFVEIIKSMNRLKSSKKPRLIVLLFAICFFPVYIYTFIYHLVLYTSLMNIVFVFCFILMTFIGPGWMYVQLSTSIAREKKHVAAALSSIASGSSTININRAASMLHKESSDHFDHKTNHIKGCVQCCSMLWHDVIFDMCSFSCTNTTKQDTVPHDVHPHKQSFADSLKKEQSLHQKKESKQDMSASMKEIIELSPKLNGSFEIKFGGIQRSRSIDSMSRSDSQSKIDTIGSPNSPVINIKTMRPRSESYDTQGAPSPLKGLTVRSESKESNSKSDVKESPISRVPSRGRENKEAVLGELLAIRDRTPSKGGEDDDPEKANTFKSRLSRRMRSDSKDSTSSVSGLRSKRVTATQKDKEKRKKEREFRQNQFFARFLRRVLQLCVRIAFGLTLFAVITISFAAIANNQIYEPLYFGNSISSTQFFKIAQILTIFYSVDSILWYFGDIYISREKRTQSKNAKHSRPIPGMLVSVDSFHGSEIDIRPRSSKQISSKSDQLQHMRSASSVNKINNTSHYSKENSFRQIRITTAAGDDIESKVSKGDQGKDVIIVDAFVNDE